MAIYDFMRTEPSLVGGGPLDFTVDISVPEVLTAGVGAGVPFEGAGTERWFEPGDNIIIQGAWVEMPHGFRQATGDSLLGLQWKDGGGVGTTIPELASGAGILLPSFCGLTFPDPHSIFVANPNNGSRQELALLTSVFRVSMANVPALLDGLTFTAQVFLLVKHTLPLAALP